MSGNSGNLDLLRACAVLSVYLEHLLSVNGIRHVGPIGISDVSQAGVLIFFVHTTLVLMLSMERMETANWSIAVPFYVRRAFRIYPLSIFTVIFVVLFSVPRMPLIDYVWVGWRSFASNLALAQNLTHSPFVLGPLWSLPLEVQMYIFLPPLFLLVTRFRGWWVPFALWCGAVGTALLQLHFHTRSWMALGLFAPCFLGGIIAFVLQQRRSLNLAFWGWPLVIAAAFAIRLIGFKSGWIACLLLGVAIPQFREIGHQGLRTISGWSAKYSYGIYLSHIIIFWYCFVVLQNSAVVTRIGACLVLSVVCPVVLYHGIEKPLINVGVHLARRIGQPRGKAGTYTLSPAQPESQLGADLNYPEAPAP